MTIYNIFAKKNYNKRHRNITAHCLKLDDGTIIHGTTKADLADRIATRATQFYSSVYMIVEDDNGIKNKLIYKEAHHEA